MSNDMAISCESGFAVDALEEVRPAALIPERRKTSEVWSLTIEERRASRRCQVHLPAILHNADGRRSGVAKSISFGGVSLHFSGDVLALLNQHIRLGFSSNADELDSLGVVCGLRTFGNGFPFGGTDAEISLAVQFVRLSPGDEQVIASLLAEKHIASGGLCINAALVSQEHEEILLDAGTRSPVVTRNSQAWLGGGGGGPRQERRRHRRIAVGVTTQVRLRNRTGDQCLPGALMRDLSSNGACVYLPAGEVLIGSELFLQWTSLAGGPQNSTVVSISAAACSVVGTVVWTQVDRPDTMPGVPGVGLRGMLAGLRFHSLEKGAMEVIEQFLIQVREGTTESGLEQPSVISEFSECFRSSGFRIVLCHDRPLSEVSDDAPIVVLAPGYGESKRDYVPLAYYLADNGFHVVRYDNVNHVGESDGTVTQFRLQDMELDLAAVLQHVGDRWPGRSLGLVATSLAGRVALKVTAGTSHVKLLVLINGIMDVRHTLQAVHQEDLIGEHLAGMRKGVVNILGLTIDADRWLAHAVQGNYADLATTQRDAERLRTPIVLFHAEHDAWVDPASIATVEAAVGPNLRHSYVVSGALHRLQESPRKARTVYRQIAESCQEELWPDRSFVKLVEPSHRQISMQNRVERERGKARRPIGKSDHVAFWKDYLQNFQTIPNVADFWRLMDHVYRLMGDCHQGERILDAGCGNGNLGVFLQLNQAFRQRFARRGDFRSPKYVGLDFVPAALAQAAANFRQVGETLQGQFYEGLRAYVPMSMKLCRADLESPLPFPDNSFDRVVCNLVIGYVRDPLFTLREYLRVLAPHGRLVLSNLKPYADLSAIYRSFVDTAKTPDQVEEGRRLLDNSGRIKEREGEGIFNFLHQSELEQLLRAAGASHPRVYPTFGNQALIAVAEKGLSSMMVAA